jgi:hypothetical protein
MIHGTSNLSLEVNVWINCQKHQAIGNKHLKKGGPHFDFASKANVTHLANKSF